MATDEALTETTFTDDIESSGLSGTLVSPESVGFRAESNISQNGHGPEPSQASLTLGQEIIGVIERYNYLDYKIGLNLRTFKDGGRVALGAVALVACLFVADKALPLIPAGNSDTNQNIFTIPDPATSCKQMLGFYETGGLLWTSDPSPTYIKPTPLADIMSSCNPAYRPSTPNTEVKHKHHHHGNTHQTSPGNHHFPTTGRHNVVTPPTTTIPDAKTPPPPPPPRQPGDTPPPPPPKGNPF